MNEAEMKDLFDEPEIQSKDNNDMVNHPVHYTMGKIECIDAIESAISHLSGMEAYCLGNIMKYLWRYKQKNGKEDLKKAAWYMNKLSQYVQK